MPKINVYLPEALADAVRDAQLPVSAICQAALERAVRDVTSVRGVEEPPPDDHPGLGMLGRFTPRARRAVTLAQELASGLGYERVGTEHMLLGIVDEGQNLALKVLESLEIDPADLRTELVAAMSGPGKPVEGTLPFTGPAKIALELTAKEALGLGHNYVGCEHLLLGLLAAEGGTAGQVLRRMGLELRTARRAVVAALAGLVHARQEPGRPTPAAPTPAPALDQILRRLDSIERRLGGQGEEG